MAAVQKLNQKSASIIGLSLCFADRFRKLRDFTLQDLRSEIVPKATYLVDQFTHQHWQLVVCCCARQKCWRRHIFHQA